MLFRPGSFVRGLRIWCLRIIVSFWRLSDGSDSFFRPRSFAIAQDDRL